MAKRQSASCAACGEPLAADDNAFIWHGPRGQQEHCSERCLREAIGAHREALAAGRRRWLAGAGLILAVVIAGKIMWHRHRLPGKQVISWDGEAASGELPRTGGLPISAPRTYGPPWPPSEEDWDIWLAAASKRWVYPLPGPERHVPTTTDRIWAKDASARCRVAEHCSVDLGGELWGEHVYAAADGIIDRVHRESGDTAGGETIRIAHLGGFVFTHYSHLAGIPRQVVRGVHVRAGDVIGLVGDTGNEKQPVRRLSFALSVRPASALPEVYWDVAPMMTSWALHTPPHGTVAGLVAEARGRGRR